MKKLKQIKNKKFVLGLFFISFLILISGCVKTPEQNLSSPSTPEEPEINFNQTGEIKIEIVTPELCTVNPSSFECSTFSVTRTKISLNFTNKLDNKVTILDFRLKSDNATIYCVGPETKTTMINTPSRNSFVLVCDGIPTGRLPYGETEELYFELDYKTSTDNTLRTATGNVNAKVR